MNVYILLSTGFNIMSASMRLDSVYHLGHGAVLSCNVLMYKS